MPAMHISRSIIIAKPKEEIKTTLNDFHNWRPWSPWLIAEPEAKLDIRADGKYYNWTGKRVGSGEMTVLSESADRIDYDLTFLKPWKSKARTSFEFKDRGDHTEVTWIMNSKLPWFMFWMKKQMEAYIGNDYERGLAMLKEYVEEGQIHSRLDFLGEQDFPRSQFIGLKTVTTVAQMPVEMEKEFSMMMKYISDKQEYVNGKPFTIYHKWDMVNKRVSYTSGIPVKSVPEDLPASMFVDSRPDMKVYTIRHTGKWSHLFETYVNSPSEASEKQMISDISFPLKS